MRNGPKNTSNICELLKQVTGSIWVAVKFDRGKSSNVMKPLRFCEAIYKTRQKNIILSCSTVCCDGARRCFGWLKNRDGKLALKLTEKAGIDPSIASKLLSSVPVLNNQFSAISLSRDDNADVFITYTSPESAMQIVRLWQKVTGQNLNLEMSGIMSVCGNTVVRSYINQEISLSLGCPDSREYGGIKADQLVIGIPNKLANLLFKGMNKL